MAAISTPFDLLKFENMERSSRHHLRVFKSCFLSPKDAVVCRHVFICFLIVAIVHLSPINANCRNSSSTPVVCHSKECFSSAADFKQNMDLSVNPCDDFHTYVCGRWADHHRHPNLRETHNWYKEQQIKIDRMIRKHLETNISQSDPKPVAQAKDMYKACLTTSLNTTDRYRFRVIKKYLKEFGLPTIPTLLEHGETPIQNYKFDWISSVAKIQRKLGLNIMIGLYFAKDHRNMDRFRLTLGYFGRSQMVAFPMYVWSALQPKGQTTGTQNERSQKSDSEANTNDNQQNVDSDVEQIENTFNSLKKLIDHYNYHFHYYPADGSNELLPLAEHFKDFQYQLPVLDKEWKEEEPTYYTVAELQNITDSYITPRKSYPVWQHYLDTLFADFPDKKLAADEKLLIEPKNVKYLCKLINFISQQSPEHIELYIWKTVIEFLVDHRFNKLETEDDCTGYVQELMSLAVIYATSEKSFLNETKPRVQQLFNDIRSEFNQMVLETEWIDAHTKSALVEESNAMEARIGFPEWILNADKLEEHYRGLKVDRFRHFENWVNALHIIVTKQLQLFHVNMRNILPVHPMEVSAYNIKVFNLLQIHGGRFQYPFYHLGLEALNYGALGWILGHELTHSFDASRRHHDKFDRCKQMWSNHSLQKFDEWASCLVEQYDSYYVPEAKGYINGSLTLNENIADNGGLREAFRAYRSYIKRNGPEPLLSGFEDFTHEQLFFISIGNQHCESLSSSAKEKILKDTHSPGKFRLLGVLSNMEEFSEAFQCPRGSKMNPEKKCRVW